MENVIKKIVLDLGKKEITLTPEQAKKLKNALDEMFGNKVVEHHYHDHWDWWPIPPIYVSSPSLPSYPYYTTYCTSNGCEASYSNNTMTLKVA